MREGFTLTASLYYRLKLRKPLQRIVASLAETLWLDVMRRKPKCSNTELREYAQIRARQLVQPRVDELLKQHPTINAALANRLHSAVSRKVEGFVRRKLDALANHGRIRPAA